MDFKSKAKTYLSRAASFAASAVIFAVWAVMFAASAASFALSAAMFGYKVVREVLPAVLPGELGSWASSNIRKLFKLLFPETTIIIQQFEGLNSNELFDAASTYLRTIISPTMERLRASKIEEKDNIIVAVEDGVEIKDLFQGAEYRWKYHSKQETQNTARPWLEIKFRGKYSHLTWSIYLPHVLERSKEIKASERRLKLITNSCNEWHFSTELSHPATFKTLAMEAELKRTIMDDLVKFVKQNEYYRKIGKAWKRGYLLHGPPGTGKSSLIAAMANYLRFDIHGLDLKVITSNTELRSLFLAVPNKSMLLIEDIDWCMDLLNKDEKKNKKAKKSDRLTLSGLLNCIDGFWSANGKERILVLSTNYKDRLDPALLQPGRTNMHIYMGYCGSEGFRVLAFNYHCVDDHPLFREIEELLKEVEVTPAEVSKELLRSDDADIALGELKQLLHKRRKDI